MQNICDKIIENEELYNEISHKQFDDATGITRENVKEVLFGRAVKVRDIINETNKLIKTHLEPIFKDPTILNYQDAVILQNFAEKLSGYTSDLDTGLAYQVRKAVAEYAKYINDDEMFITNSFFKGLSLLTLGADDFKDEMFATYLAITKYEDRYESFEKPIRSLIVRAFGNLYVSVKKFDFDKYFLIVDKARAFWGKAELIDPDFPWERFYLNITTNICAKCISNIRDKNNLVSPKYEKIVIENGKIIDNLLRNEPEKIPLLGIPKSRAIVASQECLFFNNDITRADFYATLKEIYLECDRTSYSHDSIYRLFHVSALYFHYAAKSIMDSKYDEVDYKFISKIERDITEYLKLLPKDVPQTLLTTLAINFVKGFYSIYNRYEFMSLIFNITVFRHKPTFIHSVMVAKISLVILDYIIENHPEFLIGLNNLNSVEDVRKHHNSLLKFIWYAGLSHDIGKVEMAHMISLYVRNLNDKEFDLIKKHPLGLAMFFGLSGVLDDNLKKDKIPGTKGDNSFNFNFITDDQAYEYFTEIALGHHKSYDGKFGYPQNFDNLSSPVKKIIDIITVADTLDAATDAVGRSYASEKKLEPLMDELIASKGTRYSPFLVDLVTQNEDLYIKIEDVISNYRYDVYYKSFVSQNIYDMITPEID